MASKSELDGVVVKEKTGFFRRTRSYLLEYVLYHTFLIVLLTYIAYTFYALFWAVAGKQLNAELIEANIWFIAGSFVFVPLTYIVYTRTRWEEVRHEARLKQPLRIAITYIQLIIGLMTGITFALITFINLIRFVVGFTDAGSLLTLVAPSAINAVIMGVVVFDILSHRPRRSIKLFRPIFFSICIVATAILLALTAIFGRAGAYDRQTMRDLKAISEKINEKHSYGDEVETDLAKLDLSEDIIARSKERGYKLEKDSNSTGYESTYQSSRYTSPYYKLCATFKRSTTGTVYEVATGVSDSSYAGSVFDVNSEHPAGEYCYRMYAS